MASSANPVLPKLDAPLANPDGTVSIPWYYLLIALFKKTGGATSTPSTAYIVEQPNGSLDAYNASTGKLIGALESANTPGSPVVPLVLGGSPFTFTAPSSGFVVAFGCEVELARAGSGWYKVSLTGGGFPIKKSDQMRLTWYSAQPPTAEFFPD